MDDTIKPCPFCGLGETEVYERQERQFGRWHAYCDGCGANSTGFGSKAEAIAAWNRRPPAVVTDEMVTRAAKAMHDGPLLADEHDFFGSKPDEINSRAWLIRMARSALIAALTFGRDATIDECAAITRLRQQLDDRDWPLDAEQIERRILALKVQK